MIPYRQNNCLRNFPQRLANIIFWYSNAWKILLSSLWSNVRLISSWTLIWLCTQMVVFQHMWVQIPITILFYHSFPLCVFTCHLGKNSHQCPTDIKNLLLNHPAGYWTRLMIRPCRTPWCWLPPTQRNILPLATQLQLRRHLHDAYSYINTIYGSLSAVTCRLMATTLVLGA